MINGDVQTVFKDFVWPTLNRKHPGRFPSEFNVRRVTEYVLTGDCPSPYPLILWIEGTVANGDWDNLKQANAWCFGRMGR